MVQQSTTVRARRGVHQWLALVVGLVFLVIGIAGFFVTGFPSDVDSLTTHDADDVLLGFAINPLHNIVHIVLGILGLLLWPTSGGARTYGWILFIGYGAVFVYGLLVVDGRVDDLLHINHADNWLHLGTAVVGLLIALWPRRRDVDDTAASGYRGGDATYQPAGADPRAQDPRYQDPGHQEPRRDSGYHDSSYGEPGRGDSTYQDPAYRDPDRRDPGT